uniref:p53 and DNA damage-regulated protein 1 n=1 Tax=Lygus hesperus TaxID=30085 RepID=A0A0A9YK80_LYGHE
MENPEKGIKGLTEIEHVANEILRDKSEIVALDKRRNGNREGIRALMKEKKKTSWMAVGPVLIKLRTEKAKTLLEKDQQATDTEINKLRSELKLKVNKLQDLEYKDPIPGLTLKPLSRNEFSAFKQVYGEHA